MNADSAGCDRDHRRAEGQAPIQRWERQRSRGISRGGPDALRDENDNGAHGHSAIGLISGSCALRSQAQVTRVVSGPP